MSVLKKLILVEDDSFDAEMTIRSLKQIPLANEIIWLKTGAQLLSYLEEHGTKEIAVVILDLQMPQVTGIDALVIIREKKYPEFPIVVLTSSKEAPDIKKCYQLGVSSFITKPVDHEEFQKIIKTLGLYWGIINQPPLE